MRTALAAYVLEARTVAESARIAGIQAETLQKALRKPHIRDEVIRLKRARLDGLTEKAWLTVADLASDAVSEDVKLKACRLIMEAAGEIGPGRRDESPRASAAVMIVVGQGPDRREITIGTNGVVESPPYSPTVVDADE